MFYYLQVKKTRGRARNCQNWSGTREKENLPTTCSSREEDPSVSPVEHEKDPEEYVYEQAGALSLCHM